MGIDPEDDAVTEYELEGAVIDQELIDDEDWKGLIAVRKRYASQRPGEPHALWAVADAYLLSGEPEPALAILAPLHRRCPDHPDIQWSILDALFALGRCEEDFDWLERPAVLRLGPEVLDRCYEYLRPKRRPRTVSDVSCRLMSRGYLTFDEDELARALREDDRFIVSSDEGCGAGWEVAVRRRRGRQPRS